MSLHRRGNRYNADYAKEVQSSRPSYSVKTFFRKISQDSEESTRRGLAGFFGGFLEGG